MRNSKKKVCITCGLLLSLWGAGVVEAEKGKLPLAEKYFPDAELLWTKPFRNEVLSDFVIAKKSGHAVIATINYQNFEGFIYYFAPDGELVWEYSNKQITNLKTIYSIEVDISDNGKTIIVNWYGDMETGEFQAYDREGNVLFTQTGSMGQGINGVSPEGGYILWSGEIYKSDGVRISIPKSVKPDGFYVGGFRFVSENEVLAFRRREFSIKEELEYSKQEIRRRKMELEKQDRTREEMRKAKWWYESLEKRVNAGIPVFAIPLEWELLFISLPNYKIKKVIALEKGKTSYLLASTKQGYLFLIHDLGSSSLLTVDTLKPVIRENPCNVDFDFGIKLEQFNNDTLLAVYNGNSIIVYLIDIPKGLVITSHRLRPEHQISHVYSFFYDNHKLMISGERNLRPLGVPWWKNWNWTYILRLAKNWNVEEEYLEKGLIIGTNESTFVGVYQGEEEDSPEIGIGRSCKSFTVNLLKNKQNER